MADAPAAATAKAGSFLTHKIGPLPVFVWLGAGVGLYLYFQRANSKSASAPGANQQTDPAGNVGTIDPATGYVTGSPEDQAAIAANGASSGIGGGGGSAGQSGTPGKPTYADNDAWGIAAVNYLVGLGIDATTANQAITLYLSSQPLTTSQQGDVNLAIQSLGAPPTLPGPITGNPPPVTTPGGGTWKPSPVPPITTPTPPGTRPPVTTPPGKPKTVGAPTGLAVAGKSSHSLQVKWNRVTGATGYHVLCTDMATKKIASEHDLPAAELTATFTGLQPSHSYVVDVWGLPRASGNAAHASLSVTLPRTG
jgi:hypothetical protein